MTITLAAVYTPVAIRAGSPARSSASSRSRWPARSSCPGVVALTLSPMMGSTAAARGRHRAAASRAGSTGASTPCARAYTRALGAHAALPSGGARRCGPSWSLLMVPFYMFSQQELAPVEDQGVVFGDRAGRAQLRPSTRRSCSPRRCTTVYQSFPEAGATFQITSPTGGFSGMVTKPWSERTKTTEQLLVEVGGQALRDPRHPGRSR